MGGAFRVNRVGLNPLRVLEVRDFHGGFELFGRKSNVCIFGLKIFFLHFAQCFAPLAKLYCKFGVFWEGF